MQTLCLELAVSLSELAIKAVAYEVNDLGGGFADYGESQLEYPAGALVEVGVYRYDPESKLYTIEIPPYRVRDHLSNRLFDEVDMSVLLQGLLHRTILVDEEMGAWNVPFEVPEHLSATVAALEEAGFVDLVDGLAYWREKAIPWLLDVGAVDLDGLPETHVDAAMVVLETMPDRLKKYLPNNSRELTSNDIRFFCAHRRGGEWSLATKSTSPTIHWDVILVHSALRLHLNRRN